MQRRWLTQLGMLLADESGQTMAEYGLVAAVLGVAMIGACAMLQSESGQVLNGDANGFVSLAQSPP